MEERRASTQDASVIQLGDLFLNMADLFKVYTPYVINHPTAEAVIRELLETNKLFAEFLNVRSHLSCDRWFSPPPSISSSTTRRRVVSRYSCSSPNQFNVSANILYFFAYVPLERWL